MGSSECGRAEILAGSPCPTAAEATRTACLDGSVSFAGRRQRPGGSPPATSRLQLLPAECWPCRWTVLLASLPSCQSGPSIRARQPWPASCFCSEGTADACRGSSSGTTPAIVAPRTGLPPFGLRRTDLSSSKPQAKQSWTFCPTRGRGQAVRTRKLYGGGGGDGGPRTTLLLIIWLRRYG